MSTESAQTTAQPALPAVARKHSLRQLWQVPLFFLGLCALAGFLAVRSLWGESDARLLERQLAAVRQALAQTPPNAQRALALANDLLPRSERVPQRAGEANFLLGSCYLFAADESGGGEASDLWRKARWHLEQARTLGAPAADQARLAYRLGKAWFQTGMEPQRVIDCLSSSVEDGADDLSEGYGMLAQAYLRLPQPDPRAALQVNQKRLALPTDNDDVLAPARLLQGELLLRLQEPVKARKVLARVGPGAQPKVLARARLLQAKSAQEESLWAEAAQLWEELLAERSPAATEPGRVRYYLGQCQRELGKFPEAEKSWEAVFPYGGEESQAAAFGLAELRLQGPKPAAAFESFERALAEAASADAYRNSLVDLTEARRIIGLGCLRYRETGDFERAARLAKLYEKLALAGAAQELRGLAEEAWANERRAAQDDKGAQAHAREAGLAFQACADAAPDQAKKAQWLWRSAERLLQAQAHPEALVVLKRYLEVETEAAKIGEGWFALAQVCHALQDEDSSLAAHRKCIEYPGPSAYKARFRLALKDIEDGELDKAVEALTHILELMRTVPDPAMHEQTLFKLANLLYQRGHFRMASLRLQEALERYPANAGVSQARLQLAECYRRLAADENQRSGQLNEPQEAQRHHQEQYRIWLNKAVANYQKLTDDLGARQATAPLPETEEAILRKADLDLAECRFDLGQYADAIRIYETLVSRYRNQVEQLIALRQIWRCFQVSRQTDKARELVNQLRAVLGQMDEKAFRPPNLSRQEWNQWVEWAAKQ